MNNKALTIAQKGMEAQQVRLRIHAENIANIDSINYKRQVINFANIYDSNVGTNVVLPKFVSVDSTTPARKKYDPSHPLSDESGYVTFSNVDRLIETAEMQEAKRSYEANLASFEQSKSMTLSLIDILRK